MNKKEKIYLEAKEAYYEGTPIMEDHEFDILEAELKEEGSEVINIIGYKTKGALYKHRTPMKSLDKIKFQENYIPFKEFLNWLKLANDDVTIEWSPKFDGNAVNLIYFNGKLIKGLTRGDGKEGQDITDKIKHIVPNNISLDGYIEIRGEVVISKKAFQFFANDYKNERNFVAGMLNRDKLDKNILYHLDFLAFEIKPTLDDNNLFDLEDYGFIPIKRKIVSIKELKNKENFLKIYLEFEKYRSDCPYLLDGFVGKFDISMRTENMETDHHPKWALAVKFPPKIGQTKILSIDLQVGNTGALIPVANLEPVNLDGSIVKRVILHNYQWAKDNKVGVGAEIEIVKSGDIIPKVYKVLKEAEFEAPNTYKGLELIKDGVHLKIKYPHLSEEYKVKRLHSGIVALGIKNVGPSLSERLYNSGCEYVYNLFTPDFNKENLISSGHFKEGRELDLLFENVNKLTEVEFWKVINSFKFDRCGRTMSKQIANFLCKVDYDFKGLEKDVIFNFRLESNSGYLSDIDNFLELLSNKSIKVIMPENKDSSDIKGTFEMTGSPKEHGFKVKSEFIKLAESKGFIHKSLNKDSKFLLTDNLNSSSSKMKKAEKLGVEIITYSEFNKNYL